MIDKRDAGDVIVFTSRLLTAAELVNFSVTSWGRSPKHNKDVGGVHDSLHLQFMACDCVFDNDDDVSKFLEVAEGLGLTCIVEHDHVHVQFLPLSKEYAS